jgi:glycolate oxidase
MLSNSAKNELKRIVGAENATTSKEDLLTYSYDATAMEFPPEAVVFPRTAEEVSLILKMANAERFPVVPRGAGTGFTGGSLPVAGGVVVSTERMRDIIAIDAENLTADVEPGVVTWDLQQEVEKQGLFYPPDPTSHRFSTIGGNIAECAGGPRAVKYGVTRDYVLGLEAVLPTGEIISTGVRTAKGVVGYDLTRLFVGSEGTLAFVTRATLRLIPLPEKVVTMLAAFTDARAAARAVSGMTRARIVPSVLEFLDGVCVSLASEFAGGLPRGGALLIIEVDGNAASVAVDARRAREVCMESGASAFEEAVDRKGVKDLWKARRSLSAALMNVRPDKLNEDVVVPRSRMPDLVAGVEETAVARGVVIACFGHAGDGNIHVNVMYDRKDAAEAAGAALAVEDVFRLTLSLGGTISGEHGVGITKAGYLGMELGRDAIGAMKRIKAALDPNGVLNPGKIFPEDDAMGPHGAPLSGRKQ